MRCGRLVAFLFALAATAIGGGIALLALSEIPAQTREISACLRSVDVVSYSRTGRRGVARTSTYLVLATDRHPQRFVHSLGSLWPDRELAGRLRAGDCVMITVDAAEFAYQAVPRYEQSFLFEWLGMAATSVQVNGSRWVDILVLEKGDRELISYLDSLGWDLGAAGFLALVFFAIAGALLVATVRGRTIGEVEPMTLMGPEGYSVSLGNDGLTYRDGRTALRMVIWQELKPQRLRLFTNSLRLRGGETAPLQPNEWDRAMDRIEALLERERLDFVYDDSDRWDPSAV
jgi:hypothetical protein